MRPVLPGDLDLGVWVLLAAPRADWPRRATALIAAASDGERYRQTHGRGHPRYGSGSLAAAAAAFKQAPLPECCSRGYLSALGVLIEAIQQAGDQPATS